MSRPILFIHDYRRIIEEATEAHRIMNRRVSRFLIGIVAVIALCCVLALILAKAPINLDVTQEVQR